MVIYLREQENFILNSLILKVYFIQNVDRPDLRSPIDGKPARL